MKNPSVLVIGAGVVGASAALALVERGLDVTLVEGAPQAGAGTSYANGGGITPCHAEPWNPPGTAARLFSTLLQRRLPYRLHAHALPGLIGWGSRFLANSRARRYYENARRTTRLAIYSGRCLARLRERHPLDYFQVVEGSLELYFSRADFDRAIELRRRIGDPDIRLQELSAEQAVALEPTLGPIAGEIHAALLFPEHESGDARLFSQQVAERARQLGARLAFGTRVERIECRRGKFDRLLTERGELAADLCVVAAGCQTVELLSPHQMNVPIYPVKGYSATIDVTDGDPA
ncbi:MAG: FAD-dependent oxidoreductase, partial [Xanthomonadaceae bacterium]|nr:FAD-dependent oxidoreductase [Xanthomonadaceae bacterium]